MLNDLYVYDKREKRIHRIGDERHDSLIAYVDGVRYYNLQNGDGGGVEDDRRSGYVILRSEHGMLFDEFGVIDRRFEEEIKKFVAEQEAKEAQKGGAHD